MFQSSVACARIVALVALTTGFALPAVAQNLTPPAPSLDEPDAALSPSPVEAEKIGLEVGFSAFGFVNGSFIDEPAEDDKTVFVDGTPVKLPYSGFGGVGYGGGLGLMIGWQGIAALETQIIRSFDGGAGNIIYDGVRYEFEMGQTAWHVPLLFRLSVPVAPVRPYVFGGPEWIFVPEGEATFDFSGGNVRDDWDAVADDYRVWSFGLGFDVIVPAGENDVRLPIRFKGSYNTGLGNTAEDRTDLDNCTITRGLIDCETQAYRSEWQWQAFITLGVQYVLNL